MMNLKTRISTIFFLVFLSISIIAQDQLPAATVMNEKGETVQLSDYVKKTDKPKIINIWATWCGPCRMKLSDLDQVSDSWTSKYGLEIIAVSVDIPQMIGRARKLMDDKGWDYTFFHDSNEELMTKLEITDIPYSLLLDGKGNIVSVHKSYSPNYTKELEREIKSL